MEELEMKLSILFIRKIYYIKRQYDGISIEVRDEQDQKLIGDRA